MQSEAINELASALVKAQAEFGAVPKGSVNPFFKSKYAALPDVVAHATPILTKHGLAVSQFIDGGIDGGEGLTTYLLHESGQFIARTMRLHLVKDDPQAQGSAVTYARRYAYMSVLGLVADEDDDGNSASVSRPQVQGSRPSAPANTGKISDASDPAIRDIITAAKLAPDDDFLNSLASQFNQRGSLSEKQIAAGKKKADSVLKKAKPDDFGAVLREEFGSAEVSDEEPF